MVCRGICLWQCISILCFTGCNIHSLVLPVFNLLGWSDILEMCMFWKCHLTTSFCIGVLRSPLFSAEYRPMVSLLTVKTPNTDIQTHCRIL